MIGVSACETLLKGLGVRKVENPWFRPDRVVLEICVQCKYQSELGGIQVLLPTSNIGGFGIRDSSSIFPFH